jgi:hypothetical protein
VAGRLVPFHACLNMDSLYIHKSSIVVRLVYVKKTKGEHTAKIMKSRPSEEISTRNVADASSYKDHIPVLKYFNNITQSRMDENLLNMSQSVNRLQYWRMKIQETDSAACVF